MHSALILLPFTAVIILNLPARRFMLWLAFWLALSISAFQAVSTFIPAVSQGYASLDGPGTFLKLNLSLDNLSRIMLFCIGMIVFVTLLVERYSSKERGQSFNFISLLLIILAGMNGLVLTRDIFSLYIFLEIVSIGSFILIGFDKERDAFEAAFKYVILSVVASVLMLSAIALFILVSGSTEFSVIGAVIKNSPQSLILKLALGIFVCACFIKGGLMPFHGWLPDAYSASPKAVSVFLSGIVTKCVGIYTLIRVTTSLYIFDHSLQLIFLGIGVLSVVCGAICAITQKDLKRMLAYSSISQIGYIILGLGSGSALGLAGAVFHLFNHAIFKSLLFVNSAAVESQTGTRNMEETGGLGVKMPVTSTTSVLASLSCAGIPPLAGFWSKLMIVIALWMSGCYISSVIAVLASILTLAYFLSLQRRIFFGKLADNFSQVKEAGWGLILPSLLLAALTVGVGIFFPYLINTFFFPLGNLGF